MSLSATRSPLLVTDPPPERGRSAAPGANQADTARAQASHARFANARRVSGHARAAAARGAARPAPRGGAAVAGRVQRSGKSAPRRRQRRWCLPAQLDGLGERHAASWPPHGDRARLLDGLPAAQHAGRRLRPLQHDPLPMMTMRARRRGFSTADALVAPTISLIGFAALYSIFFAQQKALRTQAAYAA